MNRGTNVPESAEPGLFDLMRWYGERHDEALRSCVGADVAESHVYWILRGVVVAVWSGADLESAIADGDRQWRAYAQRQEEKVNSAAKIKTGPRAGQSGIQHRWVSPDLFRGHTAHLRVMVRRAFEARS